MHRDWEYVCWGDPNIVALHRVFSRARCPFRCIEHLQRWRVLRRSQAEYCVSRDRATYGISECFADNHFYLSVKSPQPLQTLLEVSG